MKTDKNSWKGFFFFLLRLISIIVAVVGLFLLCIDLSNLGNGAAMGICIGDVLVMLCAFSFALHIITVDKFVENTIKAIDEDCDWLVC